VAWRSVGWAQQLDDGQHELGQAALEIVGIGVDSARARRPGAAARGWVAYPPLFLLGERQAVAVDLA
jgi:hypothetical protein